MVVSLLARNYTYDLMISGYICSYIFKKKNYTSCFTGYNNLELLQPCNSLSSMLLDLQIGLVAIALH